MMLVASLLLSATLTLVPAPDFKQKPVGPITAKSPVPLRLVSNTPNQITDTEEWYKNNELALNESEEAPEGVPADVQDLRFISAIHSDGRQLAIYGPDYAGGTHLLVFDEEGELEHALDFSSYRFAPRNVEAEREFVEQRILWAEAKGDRLYVSHGHRTYAKSSHGMNAYISAIDLRTGKPIWHSAPLVANAGNFVLFGEHIITGYGFTAEPDFLYVLRSKDGVAVTRVPVKSGPSHIIQRGDRLYVRTYDRDYLFRLN